MSVPPAVGVIANPLSGRDVRRLVSGASVFDNAEKGAMVHRLMAGLGATGVERVLMMPAGDGIGASLHRSLRGRGEAQPLPELETLEMQTSSTWRDSAEAVELMRKREVAAIVVLGGDGTHRVVARHCGEVPLCALSTGTNNSFPELREATVAGLATGLVAGGRVPAGHALRRAKLLEVEVGGRPQRDCALVDVARTAGHWAGARALWRIEDVREVVVAFARPGAVGLSAVAGLLEPVPRTAPYGLLLRLGDPAAADTVLRVPLAPGLVVPVGVLERRRLEAGEAVELRPGPGCLALDGEREIELRAGESARVRLNGRGPLTIDVDAVMAEAARQGLLNGAGLSARRPW